MTPYGMTNDVQSRPNRKTESVIVQRACSECGVFFWPQTRRSKACSVGCQQARDDKRPKKLRAGRKKAAVMGVGQ